MSSVETQNYVFDLRDVLGSGSFGIVYVGYQRLTGEPVAVKVFKRNIPQHNLTQEFEVLKSVAHENIVRLISVERHPQCGSFLAMELCLEGSLLNVLQSPKNLYGLDEQEFLILLSDMTAGVRYLRGKNFIHRDIKPGNILRSRRCNGQVIYKLIDFGSARVLEDGESFSSIWGTPEYLHPDIYSAYTTKRQTRNFSATVDLWSIGVTLYHAATGEVPFSPPQMLSTKRKGVISGKQAEPNGPIIWKEELPQTCRWNTEFKVIITRLLRGLLEEETTLTWSFERFFNEVDEIASLKETVVFHMNHLRFLVVYLKSGDGRPQLEEAITRQTSLKPDEQLLAYKYKLLGESEVSDYDSKSEQRDRRGGASYIDAAGLLLLSESHTKAEPKILLGRKGGANSVNESETSDYDPKMEGYEREGATNTDAAGLNLFSESHTKAEPIILLGTKGGVSGINSSSESETSDCTKAELFKRGVKWAGLNFLNIDPSQSAKNKKQLVANEYINESITNDLMIVNSLCKTAGGLFHNIVSQHRKTCQLKIDCLIKLWHTLKRGVQINSCHTDEVKDLEQFKARTFSSLEAVLSARTTLQDKDGIFKSIDDITSEMKTLQAKLRAHRNSFLSSNRGDHKKLLSVYLLGITKNLTNLYSACEAQTQTLANHVNAWCENVAVVFGEIKSLQEHIDKWSHHSEQLADSLYHVTKGDKMALSKRLGLLEGLSKEIADLMESQSSIIQNVISPSDKISDIFGKQDDWLDDVS